VTEKKLAFNLYKPQRRSDAVGVPSSGTWCASARRRGLARMVYTVGVAFRAGAAPGGLERGTAVRQRRPDQDAADCNGNSVAEISRSSTGRRRTWMTTGGSEKNECEAGRVPTVSQWGLVVMRGCCGGGGWGVCAAVT